MVESNEFCLSFPPFSLIDTFVLGFSIMRCFARCHTLNTNLNEKHFQIISQHSGVTRYTAGKKNKKREMLHVVIVPLLCLFA